VNTRCSRRCGGGGLPVYRRRVSGGGACSEAARVCRRKKKEYIACLEMRVMVLESQNRALIHEFKSLRELYSQYNHGPADSHGHA